MLECHVVVPLCACYWTLITQPMRLINPYTLHKMSAVSVKAVCFSFLNVTISKPVYDNATAGVSEIICSEDQMKREERLAIKRQITFTACKGVDFCTTLIMY